MCRRVPLAGACAPGAADVADGDAGGGLFEPVAEGAPGAHVLRLLLRPDDLLEPRIRRDELACRVDWEWVELLDSRDGDVGGRRARLVPDEVVVDLARAEDEPAHLLLVG